MYWLVNLKHSPLAVTIPYLVLKAAQAVPIPNRGEAMESCQNDQEGCEGPHGDELPCFECYKEGDY